MQEFYAHSVEGKPLDEWHTLEEHLKGTAELSAKFADEFGSGEWAYLAGLWHEMGKKRIGEKVYIFTISLKYDKK